MPPPKKIKSPILKGFFILYTATLIATKGVIPAKAGIKENTGFRVKAHVEKLRLRLCEQLQWGRPFRYI